MAPDKDKVKTYERKRKGHFSDNDSEDDSYTKKAKLNTIINFSDLQEKISSFKLVARVTNKSKIINFSSSILFSIDCIDEEENEFRCTAYNDAVSKIYEQIHVGQVYNFSKFMVSASNPKYNKFNTLYEIQLKADTEITLMQNNSVIPNNKYKFVTYDEFQEKNANDTIDFVGVIFDVKNVEIINSNKGTNFTKRDIILKDEFNNEISAVLWNENAKTFSGKVNSIMIIKKAKVTEYRSEKKLSIISTSTFQFDDLSIENVQRLQNVIKGTQ